MMLKEGKQRAMSKKRAKSTKKRRSKFILKFKVD